MKFLFIVCVLFLSSCLQKSKKTYDDCITMPTENCYRLKDSILREIKLLEKSEIIRSEVHFHHATENKNGDSLIINYVNENKYYVKEVTFGKALHIECQYFKLSNNLFVAVFPKLDFIHKIDSSKNYMNIAFYNDSKIFMFRNVASHLCDENYPNLKKIEKYYWARIRKYFLHN